MTSPITGYRMLNDTELALMNEGKALGVAIGAFIQKLDALPRAWEPIDTSIAAPPDATVAVDGRWLAMGKTSLQVGLMQILRSIARPTTF